MPRQKRIDEAGRIYHVLNRGNARQPIFLKPEDYEAFIRVLAKGLEKYPIELFAFTLMPNHWHFVLRPLKNGQMGKLLCWVTATHSLRYHGRYLTRGEGHIYQSRFKSFPVQDDSLFQVLSICRTLSSTGEFGHACGTMAVWLAIPMKPVNRAAAEISFAVANSSSGKLEPKSQRPAQ